MLDWQDSLADADLPDDVAVVEQHKRAIKASLRTHGVPVRMLNGIETRALRSGRRQTGEFKSNRQSRWTLDPSDPQYGSELDCKIILVRLFGFLLTFDDPPDIDENERQIIQNRYFGTDLRGGTYRDSLLLERMSYPEFAAEAETPTQGSSNFHIGHEDPSLQPRHVPREALHRSVKTC